MSGVDRGNIHTEGAADIRARYQRSRFIAPAAPSCHADRAQDDAAERAGIPSTLYLN